ncbi:MAG TPA: EAL domain-containing protein [Polyangia bacterium]|nr:EAL domain-containing protein [Polyangia bacterium]
MLDRLDTVERLHEALISLERSRRREGELRAVEASRADVVRALALAQHRHETFDSLLEALREVLPFEEAAILVDAEDGTFRPVACTCAWLSALRLRSGPMLARVVEGEIVVAFDAGLIPEWRAQAADVRARSRSVIHMPLRAGEGAVLLVCTHAEAARFEQRHIELVKGIVPLAGQILQKLDLREVLTEREQERQAQLAMFNAVVDNIQAGVLVEDAERRVCAANEVLRAIFGGEVSAGNLVGTDAVALNAGFARLAASPEAFAARIERIVRERALVSGEEIRLANGRIVERDYVPVVTPAAGFIAHFWQYRDITARRNAEEQLRRQAYQDDLTGLPNRARFGEEVNAVLRNLRRHPDRRAAVLFIDLDRFKIVNDRLGHAMGDQLLLAFVDRLRRCVRETDVVARMGGDEFTVLLADVEAPGEEIHVARRILDSLRDPFTLGGEHWSITASIGVATCSSAHDSAEEVVRDADMAMYRAKASGKDCLRLFDQNLQEYVSRRMHLEQDLGKCVERRELRVHYQPIVELATGRLHGFEALVRWEHPTSGLILPDRFMPLAEETGHVVAIDRWVLETAATQLADWRARYPGASRLRLAVNVSRNNLTGGTYPDVVAGIIERTGLPPWCLALEINENVVMEDLSLARRTMGELRMIGAHVCIDDFGTGHSSLGMLTQLAPHVLKMDRTFLADLDTNRTHREIVRTVVALADKLGIGVVAEGVEAMAEREILIEDGCLMCQGELFSPPVDAEAAERIIADGAALTLRGQTRVVH